MQPGSYCVFNPTSSVAIALLQGISIDDLSGLNLSGVAIAGAITTENLGVEHLVKNIIANPHIRNLIVYGREIPGHLPGDALLKLSEKGIDSTGRIISALGARPVLKNLTQVEVNHYRSQIQLSNRIGQHDLMLLDTHLRKLRDCGFPPFESGLRVELVETRKAEPAMRLKLDRTGWFVIMVMHGRKLPLVVEHYTNDGVLRNRVEGRDAASICATIIEMKLVSQLDHAAYLGRELAKAELSIAPKQPYIQDKAQGLPNDEGQGDPMRGS